MDQIKDENNSSISNATYLLIRVVSERKEEGESEYLMEGVFQIEFRLRYYG